MTCADDWWDAQLDDPDDDGELEPDEPWQRITDLPDIAHYQPLQGARGV